MKLCYKQTRKLLKKAIQRNSLLRKELGLPKYHASLPPLDLNKISEGDFTNPFLDVDSTVSHESSQPDTTSLAAQVSEGVKTPSRIRNRKCSWEPSTSLVNQSISQKNKRLKPGAAVDEVFWFPSGTKSHPSNNSIK